MKQFGCLVLALCITVASPLAAHGQGSLRGIIRAIHTAGYSDASPVCADSLLVSYRLNGVRLQAWIVATTYDCDEWWNRPVVGDTVLVTTKPTGGLKDIGDYRALKLGIFARRPLEPHRPG